MKPAGIANATIGLISSTASGVVDHLSTGHVTGTAVGSVGISALLLTWWVARINSGWVKLAGDAYAERLLAVCETLELPTATIRDETAGP